MRQAIKISDLLSYSVIAISLAFAGLPLYVYAPDFYVREFGLSLGLIGMVLIAIRLLDAVQDPVIGYLSDRYPNNRLIVMIIGMGVLMAGVGGLFYGPSSSFPAIVWFTVSMILSTTGFSILMINLTMIGGFWCEDFQQRTRISAWRESFFLIGVLIASFLLAVLQSVYTTKEAFIMTFWFFSFFLVIGGYFFIRFMKRNGAAFQSIKVDRKNMNIPLKFVWQPGDAFFFFIYFLSHLASALPGVIVFFFIRDYLQAGDLAGLFLGLYFVSGAVFMKLWISLANKMNKNRVWLISMIVTIVTFIWAFFLQAGDVVSYGIICVLSGIALGGDLSLPPAILADRITHKETESQATQSYAFLMFSSKIAVALASGISFLALDLMGFVAGEKNSSEVLYGLLILYALIPCVIKFLAAGCLWFFNKKEGGFYHEKIERSYSYGINDVS
jgi:GPH family glycoside/pentoside/hexuronide:cation symporter